MVKKIISLDSSQAANELAHPDVLWVKPEKNVIKIDQIEKSEILCIKPHGSRQKVVAIEGALSHECELFKCFAKGLGRISRQHSLTSRHHKFIFPDTHDKESLSEPDCKNK